jgi:aryl-alcohol dehydrogenase-like predicted oxidoreductase
MKRIGRREFLAGSLVGASGLLLKSKLAFAADPNTPKAAVKMFDPWEIVTLGKTGIKVSRVGFGTGMSGGRHSSNQVRLGKEKFEGLLKQAYDLGCRLFDCADMYGSNPYVVPALKGISRDKYTIVTKLMIWDPPAEEKEKPLVSIDRFLKEMNTDYIDLLLLHCMMAPDWNKTLKPYMDGMAEAKAKGKVRALGVSCHSMDALKVAAEDPWVESVHTRINATGTDMDGTPDEVVPIIRKIHEAGKGVVGMKLIGQGEFRDDRKLREQSADFVFNLGCVDTVVVGFESINEIKDYEDIVKKTVRKTV